MALLNTPWLQTFAELSRKCMYSTLLVVLGGDFNLIREVGDKNNTNLNLGLMERFNRFIDLYQHQELRRSGQRFTWSNNQAHHVMVTLDRVLVSTEWETKHPLCYVWSKPKVRSDHGPIILDTGENQKRHKKPFTSKNSGCWRRTL
jgi:exonuclease III